MDTNSKDDTKNAPNTLRKPQKSVESKWPWLLPISIFISCTLIYTLNFTVDFTPWFTPWTSENLGTFGDYIGGIINPIVSTLALYFLVKAYYIQKIELTETRTALRDSAKHQEKLAKTALAQSRIDEKNLRINILMVQIDSYQSQINITQSELSRASQVTDYNGTVIRTLGKRKGSECRGHEIDNYKSELIRLIDGYQKSLSELIVKAQEIQP